MKKYISKEMDDFYKGEQIAKEVVALLADESKCSESQTLDDYAVNNPSAKALFDLLVDTDKVSTIVSDYKRDEKFEGVNALKKRLAELERKRNARIVAYFTGISVACAVIVSSFIVFFPTQEKQINKVAIHNEISTPTLILNSGDTINLEATQGDIVGGDYSIKKIDSDKIAYNTDNINVESFNKIIVPCKYTYSITLDDGSEVFLNANSEFKYPVTFNGEKREVFLKGEAYFKVSKSKIPFVVTTDDISVKVYGTQFNVNTNLNGAVETILVSGSVGVSVNDGDAQEVIIKPNEMFTLNISSGKVNVRSVIANDHVAWLDGYFSCTKTPLKMFLRQISMWYGVDFEFDKDSIGDISVSVLRLDRSLDLKNVLAIIENMADVEILKKTGGDYLIK